MTSLTLISAGAALVKHEYCFDCLTENSFDFEGVVDWLGLSLVCAIPGFLVGMLVHRWMVRRPLVVRLLIVAVSVLAIWFVLVGRIDIVTFSASLLAVGVSYFDGSRVDAQHSSTLFSEH